MISEDRQRQALEALRFLLARASWLAHQPQSGELTQLLDELEYLPVLILDLSDRTADFRTALEGIADKLPVCSHVTIVFDAEH